MRIPITCGSCGRDFSAPDTHIGRKVVCPDCGTGVKVRNSGIATPSESDDDTRRSGTRRARGSGPNPKVILGILGVVAAVAAVAVGVKSLPDLSNLNSVAVTSPATQPAAGDPTAQPANAGLQPGNPADGRPANPSPSALRPAVPELEAKRKPAETSEQEPDSKAASSSKNKSKSDPVRSVRHDRAQAEDEVDTDRGQRLLGRVKTIVLVREGPKNDRNFDPQGTINKRVTDRTKSALEKAGLKVNLSAPGPKSAVLKVRVSGKASPVGTRGTQELTVSGELICFDSKAKGNKAPYASVWKHEESIGTIARQAARSGKIPEKIDRNIGDFVSRFRVAWQQAEKMAREAGEESDEDDPESMAGDSPDNANGEREDEPAMAADEETEDAVMDGEDEKPGEKSSVEENETEKETSDEPVETKPS